MDDLSFAETRVGLCSLKIKQCSGLKIIHTRFLKTGAEVRAERLTYIHLQIITPHLCSSNHLEVRSGHTVTQVSLLDPNNFRPIAAVPALKIFQRAVHKQIYKHLRTHKLQYYPLISLVFDLVIQMQLVIWMYRTSY